MPKLSDFRITKRSVDALPTDKDATYRDAELKGFAVRTKPSGSKTYLVIYRNEQGRTRSLAIGQHGAITSDDARKIAKAHMGAIAKGDDPSEDRHGDRKAMTVKDLCEDYIKAVEAGIKNPARAIIRGRNGQPKKASTLYTDRGRIERHIIPLIGKRRVRDLTPPDINRFMDDVISGKTATDVKTGFRGRAIVEGGKGTAARTVGLLGGILSYAVKQGIIPSNPARGVERPSDGRRDVRLSASQYSALGAALRASEAAGEAWQAVAACRFIALTGCRLGEAQKLKWAEVDIEGQALRLEDSKTGKSIRPIGADVVALLSALPRSGEYVFGSSNRAKPYGGLPKALKRIMGRNPDRAPENDIGHITAHALRHGFASTAHDLGLTDITIAALLGHRSATVTSRYIHSLDSALISAANKASGKVSQYIGAENDR